ncbi:MAG TPA: hypothetical protein VFV78_02690 [Vicinamibacterales bacterium]|nr:hypothetical protein [Vicinamibacterales bacterium]
MNDEEHRAVIEAAYARLRETLEAKDVSVESLRTAALEALEHARAEVELDPDWLADELRRLRDDSRETPTTPPPTPPGRQA